MKTAQQTFFNRLLGLLGLGLALIPHCAANASTVVHYPSADSAADERANYYSQLLELALSKSEKKYEVKPTPFHVEQARAILLIEAGRRLDVMWTFTTKEREERMLPIRIPIDRGLFGWRLLLIKASNQTQFRAIKSKEDLAKLRAGQGHDWPDTDILNANGFLLSGSTTYEGLFDMLSRNHIQYFPRSILEAELELTAHPDHNLAIESNIVLHYPTAVYFFVNPQHTELANDIKQGLLSAIEDGSFKRLFDKNFSAAIQRASLSKRNIIQLKNPLLSTETPLEDKRFWFSPEDNY